MKLENILLEKIDVIPSFNIRIDFGEDETRDLEESLKNTEGNVQPILVCQKKDRFELISGERRLKALKKLGRTEASCIVYDKLTDLQKSQLMYNENLGRKNLSWKEEVRAIKKLKSLGFDISIESLVKQNMSKDKAWSLLEALEYVEEFPDLINEQTRRKCIDKYRRIKRLEKEKQDAVKERKITIKEALISDDVSKAKNADTLVIEELKEEVRHYKEQVKDVYKCIHKLDKVERLSRGVWLVDEIKQLVQASRSCETFGLLEDNDEECVECHKQSPDIYAKCEFYRDEIEKEKK